MATRKTAIGKTTKSAFKVRTFGGLNEKRMQSSNSKNFGKTLRHKTGELALVQFLQPIDEFVEYDQHQFQEDGWKYVPCIGDACPLCQDESETKSKRIYRFAVNVWSFKEKKVLIYEGSKTLAQMIFYRYQRKPAMFLKRTWEIQKFDTNPVSFDVSQGEEDVKSTRGLTLHDIETFLSEEARRYYGDDMPEVSALDAEEDEDADDFEDDDIEDVDDDDESDDDEDDEDEDYEEDEESEDDEDEDDDDDEDEDDEDDEEDDEDEEDEEPAPRRRAAPAKKVAAKKAAPVKASSKTAAKPASRTSPAKVTARKSPAKKAAPARRR